MKITTRRFRPSQWPNELDKQPAREPLTLEEEGEPKTSSMCLTSRWYRLAKKQSASSESRSRLLRSTLRKVDARSRKGTYSMENDVAEF